MLKILQGKRALTLIALVVSSLLIWIFGDAISIYNHILLESAFRRFAVIALLWLFVFIWWVSQILLVKIAEKKIAKELSANSQDFASTDDKQIQSAFVSAITALRQAHKVKHGRWHAAGGLYELPWYAIIGPPGSGKTTTLMNSNLSFPLADQFGRQGLRGVGGTRLCDWWFTEEAVLIDTAGRFTSQTSDKARDQAGWLSFLQSLKKYRPSQPLNGIIVVLSAAELLDESSLTATLDNLKLRLQEIYSGLSHNIPVYLIINKMDLLQGFSEFFSLLDQESRNKVWGFTLPLESMSDTSKIKQLINEQLSWLHQKLVQLRIEKIDQEKNIALRSRILLFPEQYRLVLTTISRVCVAIAGESNSVSRPFFRGVYFTSATQFGTPIDKVLHNMGLSQAPTANTPLSSGKSYFINDLLRKVIFPEAGLVTESAVLKKKRAFLLLGICAVPVCVLLFLLVVWGGGYLESKHRLVDLRQQYDSILVNKSQLNNANLIELSGYLSNINELGEFAYKSKQQLPLSGFGLNSLNEYGDEANYVYLNALRAAFAQLLYREVEGQLRQETDKKYQLLKAYLAFADQHAIDETSLSVMLVDNIIVPKVGELDSTQRRDLIANIVSLLKARPLISKEQIDQDLVKQVRDSLKGRGLVDVTYSVLQQQMNGKVKDFVSSDAVGATGQLVFSIGQSKGFSVVIPAFFTKEAYKLIMEKELDSALASLDDERQWVLGEQSASDIDPVSIQKLKKEVMSRYLTEYVSVWSRFAGGIGLVKMVNVGDALQKTRLLTGSDDLLRKLATVIVAETSLTQEPNKNGRIEQALQSFSSALGGNDEIINLTKMTVEKPFEPLAKLLYAPEQKAELDLLFALLKEIETQLYLLDEAAKRAQTAPDSTALQVKIRAFADKMPTPISSILQSFYVMTGDISKGAMKQGLASSLRDVTSGCSKAIAGRYPFARNATKDIEFADFGKLFSSSGSILSFFDKNLKSFVDTSSDPWQPLKGVESTVAINAASLVNFQRADAIRNGFFQNSGNLPYFSFDLKWLSVPPSLILEQAKFEADGQTQSLESDMTQRINWPALPGGNYARIAVNGQAIKNSFNFQGPWAVLHLIDTGSPSYQDNGRIIKLKWSFPDGALTAEIRPSSMNHPFIPNVLGKFNCPDNL